MSREVRRVPLGWKHPVEYNEHWAFQSMMREQRGGPASRLVGRQERFVPLLADYPGAVETWEADLANLKQHRGFDWNWGVEYHLTGYKGREDQELAVHPYVIEGPDGDVEITVRDEGHLYELLLAEHAMQKPDPAKYMPVWDVPSDELGWCLYQTVSEGSPVTPVFATADELIDHLSTVGQDWDQVPMRCEAAGQVVRTGFTMGSFVSVGGAVLKSDMDADVIAQRVKP